MIYESALLESSVQLALVAAGIFFLTGLLTGVWKYLQMSASDTASSHVYVDIAHRSSLMYSFAAMLLVVFASISELSAGVECVAVLAQVLFFGLAISTYIIHGLLQDTDNQLEKPHRLGKGTLPSLLISAFMWALVVAEVGGFILLFYGVIVRLFY